MQPVFSCSVSEYVCVPIVIQHLAASASRPPTRRSHTHIIRNNSTDCERRHLRTHSCCCPLSVLRLRASAAKRQMEKVYMVVRRKRRVNYWLLQLVMTVFLSLFAYFHNEECITVIALCSLCYLYCKQLTLSPGVTKIFQLAS